jgi:hypothetical protein
MTAQGDALIFAHIFARAVRSRPDVGVAPGQRAASLDGRRACCPRVAPRRRLGTLFVSLLLLRARQEKGLS